MGLRFMGRFCVVGWLFRALTSIRWGAMYRSELLVRVVCRCLWGDDVPEVLDRVVCRCLSGRCPDLGFGFGQLQVGEVNARG